MPHSSLYIARPLNEPIKSYLPGSPERASLKAKLTSMAREKVDIPCIIGGKEVRTGNKRKVVMPHAHGEVLAEFHLAGREELQAAATAALKAKASWEAMGWRERAAIFQKAADLLAGPWRDTINGATMLGQSKSVFQGEIDSVCETIDFLKYGAHYMQQIQEVQPAGAPGVWNQLEYRPLEGFVLAITPFNFTAIGANLTAVPALAGNTVVWKPSDTQVYSAYYTMKLFEEAGLPPGVINFVPADGPLAGQTLVPHRELAGINFTGSTSTFQTLWKGVGENIAHYKSYPRLSGETGGKDFIFAHPSADVPSLVTALVRGAFEYQGQKCSAASRTYIPRSLWKQVEERMLADIKTITWGDVRDFRHLMNAVIDERSFKKIGSYIDHARNATDAKIIAGGKTHGEEGYFVEPTVILADQPKYKSMVEEIFGPVLTVYVYDDNKIDETLTLVDESTAYALTGSIFAQDRYEVARMTRRLRHSAGNFYINDKCTGAVVGQQPFGGARASGTNDKAGSIWNLTRWMSPRLIKETFVPPVDYRYPFMSAE